MVWYGMVWYGMVGMGWYGMDGMVWHEMVSYCMVWYGKAKARRHGQEEKEKEELGQGIQNENPTSGGFGKTINTGLELP